MQELAAGRVAPTESAIGHLDRCLGCRACETACPSGVGYGSLIENARVAYERDRAPRRSFVASRVRRLLLGIMAEPARLERVAAVMALYERTGLRRLLRATGLRQRLPVRLRRLEGLYPPLTRPRYRAPAVPAAPIARVALLMGCVMRVAYGDVHTATARVLSRLGVAVVDVPSQLCCGALHAHAGAHADAVALAKRNIEAFESASVDAVVVDAAGCGAQMKMYGHLLQDDDAWRERAATFSAKVRDVTEYIASLDGGARLGHLDRRVTYQSPCHLAHAQRITQQPRDLLRRVGGLELIEMADAEVCCGSAGSYNLQQPEFADALLRRKVDAILATGADAVVSANPGCMLQVQSGLAERGKDMPVLHVVEVLDRAMS